MRWLTLFFLCFAPLFSQASEDDDQLYLSLNINSGERLVLSDGSTYEIAPIDRIYSTYWITPFPIMLNESGDPNYPVKIINMNTDTFVRGKQLVTSEVIEEERQKRLEQEKMRKPTPQPQQPKKNGKPPKKPLNQPKPSAPSQQDSEGRSNSKLKPSPTRAYFRQELINQ